MKNNFMIRKISLYLHDYSLQLTNKYNTVSFITVSIVSPIIF